MVRHGEIWWYDHPQRSRRPYLVLTRDEAIPVLARVLGVPATRTIRDIPTEVRLGRDDGMPTDCVLTVDNITTIRRALLTERITALGPARLHEVCSALAFATAC